MDDERYIYGRRFDFINRSTMLNLTTPEVPDSIDCYTVKVKSKIKAFEILNYETIAIAGGLFADNYKDYTTLFIDAGINVSFKPYKPQSEVALVLLPGWQGNDESASDAIIATEQKHAIFDFNDIKDILNTAIIYRFRLLYGCKS